METIKKVGSRFPEKAFQECVRLNPFWTTCTCFTEMVKGKKNMTKRTIRKYFDKLVEKDDFANAEKTEILNYLYSLVTADFSGSEGV